jgi:hypothetical protein
MPQARGINFVGTMFEETEYGVEPASPEGFKIYGTSFGLQSTQNLIDSEILNGERARSRPARGNIDVSGAFPTELAAEWMVPILKHALGSIDTTGSGPYEHVLTIGDLPIGLTFEKDHGPAISGSGRYERFYGCRVASMALEFPVEGYCTASFDIRGRDSALKSAAFDSDPLDAGHTSFFSTQVTSILEDGDAIATVQSATINLDNGLDDSIFGLGGGGKRRALPEGFASVTGELTALFEDAALLTKIIDGTSSSLKIVLSRGDGLGTAGNESMEFLVQNLDFERVGVPVPGPAGLTLTVPFRAYRVTTDAGLEITVKNMSDLAAS